MITYIDDNDVKNNLPVKECVDELKEAFISYGKGESDSSPRDRIYGKDFVFSTMPALYEKRGIAGLKTYMYGKSGYRFFVILFSTENPGKLFAMDANVLGQIRTGEEKEDVSKKGFHIAGSYGLNKIYALDIARTSLEEIRCMLDKNIGTVEKSDLIYISCTAMPTSKILEKLSSIYGKPVLSENSAILWKISRITGNPIKIPGLQDI